MSGTAASFVRTVLEPPINDTPAPPWSSGKRSVGGWQSPAMAGCCCAEPSQPTVSRRRVLVGARALGAARRDRRPPAGHRHRHRKSTNWSRNSSWPRTTASWRPTPRPPPQRDRAGADRGRLRAVGARAGVVRRDGPVRGKDAPTSDQSEPTSTTAEPRQDPHRPEDVIDALRASAAQRQPIWPPRSSGYRAGLLGFDRRLVHRVLQRRAGTARTAVMTSPLETDARTSVAARGCGGRRVLRRDRDRARDHLRLRHRVRALATRGQLSGVVRRWPSTANGATRRSRCCSARSVTAPVAAAGYQLPMRGGQPDRCGQPGGADGEGRRVGVARGRRAGAETEDRDVRRDGADRERGDGRPMEAGAGRLARSPIAFPGGDSAQLAVEQTLNLPTRRGVTGFASARRG